MPVGLARPDRWLLGGGICIFVVLAIVTAFTGEDTQEASTVPSVFSTTAGGARAAYLLLSESNRTVKVWEEEPSELPPVAEGEAPVFIVAEPAVDATATERRSIEAFIERGGTVLFCGEKVKSFFRGVSVNAHMRGMAEEFGAQIPSPLSQGAPRVNMKPTVEWRNTRNPGIVVYGDNGQAAVVTWRKGKGQAIWWAAATPLTNAGIGREDNLRLFLNSVGNGPVYWDEYFHGERSSLFAHTAGTPLLWAALQLGVGTALVLFTFARRRGPVIVPAKESRLSPLEFASTMGGLYKRAKAADIPVEICYRNLRLQLVRRLGTPADATDALLAHLAGERLGMDSERLQSAMSRATAVQSAHVGAREALALVREIESFRTELR